MQSHKNIPRHTHLNQRVADADLVAMIHKEAAHTSALTDDKREMHIAEVESAIANKCAGYKIKPDSYFTYYMAMIE